MPWHRKSTKDATSCDKPRVGANTRSTRGSPNGGTQARGNALASPPEYIGRREATRGTETSKYPEERKSTETALVAASERALSLNPCTRKPRRRCDMRVVGPHRPGLRRRGRSDKGERERNGLERPAEQGESPVREAHSPARDGSRVAPDT